MLNDFVKSAEIEMLQEMLDYCCISEALQETAVPSYSTSLMEGVNIDSIASVFSENANAAKNYIKKGNRLYSDGRYSDAKKEYEQALKVLETIKGDLTGMKNKVSSTILAHIVDCITPITSIMQLSGTIITRKFTSDKDLIDAKDETMSNNVLKNSAVAVMIKQIKWCKVRIHQCESELKRNA